MEAANTDTFFKITPEIVQEVRKTVDMHQDGVMSDVVDILEEWLKKQEHFVKKDFDRNYLERTIIRAKGSVERSKQRLDKLCTAKTLLPHFFEIGKLRDLSDLDVVDDLFLPRLTSDNHRVYLLRNTGQNFGSAFYTNYFKRALQYLEYLCAHDYSNGMIVVFDYRETNLLSMVKGLNLVEMQQIFNISLDCYGFRIKGIHMVSESKVVEMLVALFKQMLSAKVGGRIHVHKNLESLHEQVEKDVLPVEYGGTEKSLKEISNEFLDVLESQKHVEYMKTMSTARTNETYRKTDKFNEDCLGLPGTFRALKVD